MMQRQLEHIKSILGRMFKTQYTITDIVRDLGTESVVLLVPKRFLDRAGFFRLVPDVQYAILNDEQQSDTAKLFVKSRAVLESAYQDYINDVVIGVEEVNDE